jgi:pimeloyl-ACP methyl ester carboxylesterase
MRVHVGGEGSALLAIHGLGGSGRYWAGLVEEVGDRFRVIAPDLAGFGASDKPHAAYDRPMQLENLDAALQAFEPQSGGGPVTVVAHSLGAVFAAIWAARHAGSLRGVALAAAAWPSADGGPGWARREHEPAMPFRVAGRAVRALWPAIAVPVGIVRGYPAGVAADFGRQTLRSRTRTLFAAIYDPALAGELEAVGRALGPDIPQLLINARDDRTVPISSQVRWAAILPHATTRQVESGGHQFLLRDGFHAVTDWLRALPPAGNDG